MKSRDHATSAGRILRLGDLKVLTWNVLAAAYATKKMFPYVSKLHISLTKYRGEMLQQMIARINPDLMALQEVDCFASIWRPMLLALGYDVVYANRGESESPLIYCSACPQRQAYYDALLAAQQDALERVSRGACSQALHTGSDICFGVNSSSALHGASPSPIPVASPLSPQSPFTPPPSRRKKDGCLLAFRASELSLLLPAMRVDMDELAVDGGWAAWSHRGYAADGYTAAAAQAFIHTRSPEQSTSSPAILALASASTPASATPSSTSPASPASPTAPTPPAAPGHDLTPASDPATPPSTAASPCLLPIPAHALASPLPRYLRDNVALFLPLLRMRVGAPPVSLLAATTHLFWSPLCEDVKLWQAVYAVRVAEALRAVLAAHCSAGPLHLPPVHVAPAIALDDASGGAGVLTAESSPAVAADAGPSAWTTVPPLHVTAADVPVVFCGDLNCLPRSLTYQFLQTGTVRLEDVRAYDGIHPPPSLARQSVDALPGLFPGDPEESAVTPALPEALPEGAVRVNPDNPFVHAGADAAREDRAVGERRWREQRLLGKGNETDDAEGTEVHGVGHHDQAGLASAEDDAGVCGAAAARVDARERLAAAEVPEPVAVTALEAVPLPVAGDASVSDAKPNCPPPSLLEPAPASDGHTTTATFPTTAFAPAEVQGAAPDATTSAEESAPPLAPLDPHSLPPLLLAASRALADIPSLSLLHAQASAEAAAANSANANTESSFAAAVEDPAAHALALLAPRLDMARASSSVPHPMFPAAPCPPLLFARELAPVGKRLRALGLDAQVEDWQEAMRLRDESAAADVAGEAPQELPSEEEMTMPALSIAVGAWRARALQERAAVTGRLLVVERRKGGASAFALQHCAGVPVIALFVPQELPAPYSLTPAPSDPLVAPKKMKRKEIKAAAAAAAAAASTDSASPSASTSSPTIPQPVSTSVTALVSSYPRLRVALPSQLHRFLRVSLRAAYIADLLCLAVAPHTLLCRCPHCDSADVTHGCGRCHACAPLLPPGAPPPPPGTSCVEMRCRSCGLPYWCGDAPPVPACLLSDLCTAEHVLAGEPEPEARDSEDVSTPDSQSISPLSSEDAAVVRALAAGRQEGMQRLLALAAPFAVPTSTTSATQPRLRGLLARALLGARGLAGLLSALAHPQFLNYDWTGDAAVAADGDRAGTRASGADTATGAATSSAAATPPAEDGDGEYVYDALADAQLGLDPHYLPPLIVPDPPANAPRLLLTEGLFPLAKSLRMVGVDTAYNDASLSAPAPLFAQARAEGRLILTGSTKLSLRANCPPCVVVPVKELAGAQKQFQWVLRHFNLRVEPSSLFLRCTLCNGHFQPVSLAQVRGMRGVPVAVKTGVCKRSGRPLHFQQCVPCGQLYWWGGRTDKIADKLTAVARSLDEATVSGSDASAQADVDAVVATAPAPAASASEAAVSTAQPLVLPPVPALPATLAHRHPLHPPLPPAHCAVSPAPLTTARALLAHMHAHRDHYAQRRSWPVTADADNTILRGPAGDRADALTAFQRAAIERTRMHSDGVDRNSNVNLAADGSASWPDVHPDITIVGDEGPAPDSPASSSVLALSLDTRPPALPSSTLATAAATATTTTSPASTATALSALTYAPLLTFTRPRTLPTILDSCPSPGAAPSDAALPSRPSSRACPASPATRSLLPAMPVLVPAALLSVLLLPTPTSALEEYVRAARADTPHAVALPLARAHWQPHWAAQVEADGLARAGILTHSLQLSSVFSCARTAVDAAAALATVELASPSAGADAEPQFTNLVAAFHGCLDYVFVARAAPRAVYTLAQHDQRGRDLPVVIPSTGAHDVRPLPGVFAALQDAPAPVPLEATPAPPAAAEAADPQPPHASFAVSVHTAALLGHPVALVLPNAAFPSDHAPIAAVLD